ncbi:thioesterase [Bacillus fungorum]|uniref:Thioesterase n=1 Tax=Bacillus fungorum TaxID=2039284 RepID=A0A2G6Q6Q4_9BACI|nr:thioesterase domain-containing protein [Bacillus fungorum]PIE92109.1 thioesterase [Bacillus fungorum]
MKKIKLFCLPYAGGSAMAYNKLRSYVNVNIDLIPLELAGRGSRFNEPFYESFENAVSDICSIIAKHQDSPIAILGHSMGAWLVFETYHQLKKKYSIEPLHLFFSGNYPPTEYYLEEKISFLNDENFKDKILGLGGTPKEIFDNEEICNAFLPIIRSDYQMVESYEYESHEKMACDISIFYGDKEGVNQNQLEKWKDLSFEKCEFYEFNGDHFFLFQEFRKIATIINNNLV